MGLPNNPDFIYPRFNQKEWSYMSGTGDSGGGVYEAPADNCELLIIQTQLSSPKEEVVDTIQIKDVLDVALQTIGNTTVVVALHRGKLVFNCIITRY